MGNVQPSSDHGYGYRYKGGSIQDQVQEALCSSRIVEDVWGLFDHYRLKTRQHLPAHWVKNIFLVYKFKLGKGGGG